MTERGDFSVSFSHEVVDLTGSVNTNTGSICLLKGYINSTTLQHNHIKKALSR